MKSDLCRLSDLGQGIVLAQFLSPEIQEAHFEALSEGLSKASRGLLIACEGPDFALGASLKTLAANIDGNEWDELDRRGRLYQQVNQSLRRSPFPVVAALRGYVLGAGCEIALHCHSLVVAPDTRMGLVETRAGLLPAAGGTLEMTRRAHTPAQLMQNFSTLALGRLAADPAEAFTLGYLDPERDLVQEDPRRQALERLACVEPRAQPTQIEVLCPFSELCARSEEWQLNAYDRHLARTIAGVMCAGQAPGERVSPKRVLDLERAALRNLAGQGRTRARIRHLLQSGLVAERRPG